jgi:hypothetical protein
VPFYRDLRKAGDDSTIRPADRRPSEPATVKQPDGDISDVLDEALRITQEILASDADIFGAFDKNARAGFEAEARFETSLQKLHEGAPAMERDSGAGRLPLLVRQRGLTVPMRKIGLPDFAPAQQLPGNNGVLPAPGSTHPMLDPDVEAKVKAIEYDAKTKGWTDQDLWSPEPVGTDQPRLAYLMRPYDSILEVTEDAIKILTPMGS